MPKRDRKRPYAERTFSWNRTISAKKSAGTKRPRNGSKASIDKTMHGKNPPMDFRSRFQNIDEVFGASPILAAQRVHKRAYK